MSQDKGNFVFRKRAGDKPARKRRRERAAFFSAGRAKGKTAPEGAAPAPRNKRKKLSTELKNRRRASWFFLSPSIAGVTLFFVAPFAMVIYYAVTSRAVNGEFVGLDNFRALFQNNAFLRAAVNTLILLGSAVPLAVLLSLGLALLLEREIPGKSFLRSAFLSPLMVPVASVVLIWQVLFHQHGVVNTFLSGFGIEAVDWFHSSWSRFVVLLLYLWKNLGYNMILFTAALAAVPREHLEVAELEGAGRWRTFWSVKLPYLSSTILFVTILSLISAMKIFREVYLLTGAYPYETLYLLQHFMNNTFASMDYQKLSTAAIVLAAAMSVVIAVLFLVEWRIGKDAKNE